MTVERWTDTMLDRLSEAVRGTSQNIQAQLRIAQAQQESLEQLSNSVSELRNSVSELGNSVSELRAGQAQQAAVLDYLLRKEQERNDP